MSGSGGDGGGFNTQPPEGGWVHGFTHTRARIFCFNTQPPEGGWYGAICFVA